MGKFGIDFDKFASMTLIDGKCHVITNENYILFDLEQFIDGYCGYGINYMPPARLGQLSSQCVRGLDTNHHDDRDHDRARDSAVVVKLETDEKKQPEPANENTNTNSNSNITGNSNETENDDNVRSDDDINFYENARESRKENGSERERERERERELEIERERDSLEEKEKEKERGSGNSTVIQAKQVQSLKQVKQIATPVLVKDDWPWRRSSSNLDKKGMKIRFSFDAPNLKNENENENKNENENENEIDYIYSVKCEWIMRNRSGEYTPRQPFDLEPKILEIEDEANSRRTIARLKRSKRISMEVSMPSSEFPLISFRAISRGLEKFRIVFRIKISAKKESGLIDSEWSDWSKPVTIDKLSGEIPISRIENILPNNDDMINIGKNDDEEKQLQLIFDDDSSNSGTSSNEQENARIQLQLLANQVASVKDTCSVLTHLQQQQQQQQQQHEQRQQQQQQLQHASQGGNMNVNENRNENMNDNFNYKSVHHKSKSILKQEHEAKTIEMEKYFKHYKCLSETIGLVDQKIASTQGCVSWECDQFEFIRNQNEHSLKNTCILLEETNKKIMNTREVLTECYPRYCEQIQKQRQLKLNKRRYEKKKIELEPKRVQLTTKYNMIIGLQIDCSRSISIKGETIDPYFYNQWKIREQNWLNWNYKDICLWFKYILLIKSSNIENNNRLNEMDSKQNDSNSNSESDSGSDSESCSDSDDSDGPDCQENRSRFSNEISVNINWDKIENTLKQRNLKGKYLKCIDDREELFEMGFENKKDQKELINEIRRLKKLAKIQKQKKKREKMNQNERNKNKNKNGDTVSECKICRKNVVNTILIPCTHAFMCQECCQKAIETDTRCPICRAQVTAIQPMILS